MSALKITHHKSTKLATFAALTAALAITSGCQSLQGANATTKPAPIVQPQN